MSHIFFLYKANSAYPRYPLYGELFRCFKSICSGLALLACLGSQAMGAPIVWDDQQAYQYLNQLRRQAGLTPLSANEHLARAARGHARYMSENGVVSHRQRAGRKAYTGTRISDRVLAAGYGSTEVSENVSRGQNSIVQSIDDLMSGIYHRFGFLDAEMSKLGVGIAQRHSSQPANFAYLMGDQTISRLCQGQSYQGKADYNDDACRGNFRISARQWREAKDKARRGSTKIIIWPTADSGDTPPAFYDEIPDPLPGYEVSGYPVSIEFNAAYFGKVSLRKFELRDGESGKKLPVAALMDQHSDPHHRLTAHQFALFPRDRLEWGHPYTVAAVYRHEGEEHSLMWKFSTRALPYPLVVLSDSGAEYSLQPNRTTALYWPPRKGMPLLKNPNWTFPRSLKVTVGWQDENTLLVNLQGKPCDRAGFSFDGGYRFSLVVAEPGPARSRGNACGSAAVDELPGNVIAGEGELLQFRSGEKYVISVRPSPKNPSLGKIHYRYTRGMQIKLTRLSKYSIELRIVGKRGDRATFSWGDDRSFTIVIGS